MNIENKTNRTIVEDSYIVSATSHVMSELAHQLDIKGRGTLASKHEIYGIIAEEILELLCAIQANEPLEKVQKELQQIAVACIFGDACITAKTVDW